MLKPSTCSSSGLSASWRKSGSSRRRGLWYLLMLWCIGGYAGLHRIALGSRRVASAQVLSGILGIALVVLSDTLLHPRKIDASTYPFQEAYIVAGISYGFAGVSFLMWARDGYLLLRLRLSPATQRCRVRC